MCYRDRAFCDAKCKNIKCPFKLTEQVKRQAATWWGKDNPPIASEDMSEDCPDYKRLDT